MQNNYEGRRAMEQQRWKAWTSTPAIPDSMVLDSDPLLYLADKDEILRYIPPINGASILELGCGIGRFTGELSHRARDVTAVDFIQEYIDVVQSNYGHLGNLTLVCADILKVELPKENFDMVFTGWMYSCLSNREAVVMTERVLDWLRPGGHFIFRESGPYTNNPDPKHPCHLRLPLLYDRLLKGITRNDYTLTIIRCRNSLTQLRIRNFVDEMLYIAQKVPSYTPASSLPAIIPPPSSLPLATIKGQDFKGAGVVPGSSVLVLGCGSGCLVLHLARTCRASVLGLDPVMAAINTAICRQHRLPHEFSRLVQFEMISTEDAEFDEASFNVILVRDSELRTPHQYRLLPKLRKWVKPGGSFYIFDDNTYQDDEPPVESLDFRVVGLTDEDVERLEKEALTGKQQ